MQVWHSQRLLSDNGTSVVNFHGLELCEQYGIDHVKSSLYYPEGNAQAEATNMTLLRILSRTVYEEPKGWADFISLLWWAYRPSKHTSTDATSFFLAYGAEAMVPIDFMVSLALVSKISDPHNRIHDIEALEEKDKTQKIDGRSANHKSEKPTTSETSNPQGGGSSSRSSRIRVERIECFKICS